ncbi:energy transducer TonB [Tenacibaculum sp. MEBiC06402]|uniref:energy transducer TonB n=1 Tax=unclassified Tenacibaculum TaxID=2635139 RepID=UPI003B998D8B
MKTPLRLLVYLFLVNIITAQTNNTCTSKVVVVEDLNTIDKCKAINNKLEAKDKPERQIFLKLSHDNNRFLRKRKPDVVSITKAKEAVKAVSELDAKGLKTYTKSSIPSSKLVTDRLSSSAFRLTEVDFIPVFDTCNGINDISILKCFKGEIAKHIQNNFEYPEEAIDENITGKITVKFLFDKDGKIKIEEVIDENQDKILGNYTKNLILKLPKFTPAKKKGITVPLSYELSLDFSL